ncbi:NHL domain-containing protein [Methyloradius palustris]|uniref:Teneurin NHL domain-containing protein n=1 Tax=Methyloradius palustris TaxID=2778876 RepID=A0A8D5K1B8_9PROT|nr:hypothetical protein [Methyloradius palustris]BCM25603.1 hypothetical protein ZMTM_18620 [Methyloradius palustris]
MFCIRRLSYIFTIAGFLSIGVISFAIAADSSNLTSSPSSRLNKLYAISKLPIYQSSPTAKDTSGSSCGDSGLFNENLKEIDGPRDVARIGSIGDIAFDRDGNLFFTDEKYHTIRVLSVDGQVMKVAGQSGEYGCNDGKIETAHLFNPYGIEVDKNNNIYFYDHHMIRKIEADGSVSTLAGSSNVMGHLDGVGKQASFWGYQVKITMGLDGNLYVADQNTLRRVSPQGDVLTLVGNINSNEILDGVGRDAKFISINSVQPDSVNNIYLLDAGVVRKVNDKNQVITLPVRDSNVDFCKPLSMALGKNNLLYLGSFGSIRVFDHSGIELRSLVNEHVDCNTKERRKNNKDLGIVSILKADSYGNLYGVNDLGLFQVLDSGEVKILVRNVN